MNQNHPCQLKHLHQHCHVFFFFFNLYTLSSEPPEVPNFFLPSFQLEASMRAIQLAAPFRESLSDPVSMCQHIHTLASASTSLFLCTSLLRYDLTIIDTGTDVKLFFDIYTYMSTPETMVQYILENVKTFSVAISSADVSTTEFCCISGHTGFQHVYKRSYWEGAFKELVWTGYQLSTFVCLSVYFYVYSTWK